MEVGREARKGGEWGRKANVEERRWNVGYSFGDCSGSTALPNNMRNVTESQKGPKVPSTYALNGTSGHPKANAIRFSNRAVTISVQIGSPGCFMVNLAVAFLSGDVTGS